MNVSKCAITILFLLLGGLMLQAQQDTNKCITLDSLVEGARFGTATGFTPGKVFYREGKVALSLQPFVNPLSGSKFGEAVAKKAGAFGKGLYLSGTDVAIKFDFSTLDTTVAELCFKVQDGGGEKGFKINNRSSRILTDWRHFFPNGGEAEVLPGIKGRLIVENPSASPFEATICLSGSIDSFMVFGNSFSIDGLCYQLSGRDTTPQNEKVCLLKSLEAEIVNCYPDGSYDLRLSLFHTGNPNDSVAVVVEGNRYGPFRFGEFPLTLQKVPVLTDALTFMVMACTEKVNPSPTDSLCCVWKEVVKTPCPSEKCTLFEPKLTDVECNSDGTYNATLSFEYENTGEKFLLETGSGFRMEFRYDQLPIRLSDLRLPAPSPLTPDLLELFTVCNLDSTATDACCASAVILLPDCATPTCDISNLSVWDIECLPDSTYNLTLNFQHSATGETFRVTSLAGFNSVFRYDQLPIRLQGLRIPSTSAINFGDVLVVCDINSEECCRELRVALPCQPNTPCELGQVSISNVECLLNGSYNVTIDFPRFGQSEKFILKTEGGFSQEYRYDQLPLRLTNLPLRNPSDLTDRLSICDAAKPTCCAFAQVTVPCTPPACQITDLTLNRVECRNNATYDLEINFKYQGNGQKFVLTTSAGYRGEFNYSQLPLRLSGLPLPLSGSMPTGSDLIRVCDLAAGNTCCAEEKIALPCQPPCRIQGLQVQATPCDDQKRYFVRLNFVPVSVSGNFILEIDGQKVGKYRYSDLPLRLGPFRGPLTAEQSYVVYAETNSDCRDRATLLPFDCNSPNCQLDQLLAYEIVCRSDGKYDATITFQFRAVGAKFRLKTAGGFEEVFSYSELPLRLSGLPIPSGPDGILYEDVLEICDVDNGNCCVKTQVHLPCRQQCELHELTLRAKPCQADSTFMVSLNLAADGVGSTFTLFVNQTRYGQFSYQQLPIEIGPFKGNGQTLNFRVVDDSYGCYASERLQAESCDGSCRFSYVTAKPLVCENDSFQVELDFVPNNPGASGFYVFSNGAITGPFSYDSLPLRIGPFVADGRTLYSFLLVDQAATSCFGYAEIDPFFCGDCPQTAPEIKPLGCNPDGSYRYRLNFSHNYPETRTFSILVDGRFVGRYQLSELPLNVNLRRPTDADRKSTLKICFDAPADCCLEGLLEWAECSDNERLVWPGDANSDNVANNYDLLYIGFAYSSRGSGRAQRSIEWDGMPTTAWSQFFPGGINFKHADTNGDGVVNASDTLAIHQNYGKVHGTVSEPEPLPNTDFDPPVFVEFPNAGELSPGMPFEVPIMLGTVQRPVNNIYGLAFRVKFDPRVIRPETVDLSFPTTWFGQPGVNVLTIDKSFAAQGYIDVALTRTDQNDVSGFGPIVILRGIIDDIAGVAMEISVEDATGVDLKQKFTPLSGQTRQLQLSTSRREHRDLRQGLRLFPNPTNGMVLITHARGLPVEWVEVLDVQGRRQGEPFLRQSELSLADLPNGVYFLRMKIGDQIVTERVVKF